MRHFAILAIMLLAMLTVVLMTCGAGPPLIPQPDQVPTIAPKHPTGLKLPSLETRRANHAAEARRHAIHYAKMAMKLAEPLPVSYDCSQFCTPIKDQGQCGSCWDFSGTCVVESANIKNKNLKDNSTASQLSEQYTLDGCDVSNGGCGGDDATTIFGYLKSGGGIPLTSVYGGYQAREGSCQLTTTAVGYTINDWGYCSQSTGVPNTDSIKAAMLTYGPISVCIAADGAFQNISGPAVFHDTGYDSINHQVILVGWDDTKKAWRLRNSWSTDWGDKGYAWVAYGANQVGTEAMWATAGTPVLLQPNAPPTPPPWTPTRRLSVLLRELDPLVEKYQSGTANDQRRILNALDRIESEVKTAKKELGLAP